MFEVLTVFLVVMWLSCLVFVPALRVVHRLMMVCVVVLCDRCARCMYSINAVVSVICAREPAAALMFW